MRRIRNRKTIFVGVILIAIVVAVNSFTNLQPVDFSAEVKPLLNKKCISCHGGVKKDGGFSVLFESEALDTTENGKPAIIPGKPDESELIRRITSTNAEERMPYNHDPLTSEEINLLKRWIKEGAKWGEHWAYVPVKPVKVPNVASGFYKIFRSSNNWVKNPIDYFIYEQLKEEKMDPSPMADKATLLRRVSLDITGVPPSEAVANRFLHNNQKDAYEQLIDTLLAAPQYGERWTAMWMDLARYADSKGYEKDSYRNIWRYRDWLIKAFNRDMPYDRFLTEQLAGDLLPDVTDEAFIATAFHRNTVTNDEGGSDNEEFRVAAVMDRVNTTWEALMGTTFGCVQCHSHPYDPFKHDEYYKFMAFFNNSRDEDTVDEYPLLREYKGQDSLKFEALKTWLISYASKEKQKGIIDFLKTGQPAINSHRADQFVHCEIALSEWLSMSNHATCRLANVNLEKKNKLLFRYRSSKEDSKWTIYADSIGGPVVASTILKPSSNWTTQMIDISSPGGRHNLYFRFENPHVKKGNEDYLAYFDWFHFTDDFPGKGSPGYDTAYQQFTALLNHSQYTATPVMVENPPDMHRSTFVFNRGNWMDRGQEVQPDVPAVLNAFPANAPRNRLGLAMWMTAKQNPLTARTAVNRIWEQFMGQGIVETLEDIGTQGIAPTHQHLLDWLSGELMHQYNWSLKKLIKTIAMSATYQQSSVVKPEVLEKDQFNKFYARGPRVRLTAEQIRDQGLSVAGLLSNKMYGASVMPYQPKGVWLSPYAGNDWVKSKGADQYRRAIYTHWKRAAPYPTLLGFDGVSREVCQSRRMRTNTPLQALALLNDSAYLEMAKHFADRMRKLGGKNLKDQISKGYELAMYKTISKKKLQSLEALYTSVKLEFIQDEQSVYDIIDEPDVDQAALVVVANAMLNLDEFITKN